MTAATPSKWTLEASTGWVMLIGGVYGGSSLPSHLLVLAVPGGHE